MNPMTFYKLLGSIAALGFVIAIVAAILYFMELPIFNITGLAWIFFYGLVAFAVAVFVLIVRAIWDMRP
jgi:hypothetical protein